MDAMGKEFEALMKNRVLKLVPPPRQWKIISIKWIFTVKLKPNRPLKRYKSGFVANGFLQIEGIDYNETFIPIVKPTSMRVVLIMALSWG